MNLHSLVVVALRLIALNFLLQAVISLTPQLYLFADLISDDGFEVFDVYTVVSLIVVIGIVVGSFLIWVFSYAIARFVVGGLPREVSFGSLSVRDCYSIVFLGVGLYYFVDYFPTILTWAHYLVKLAATSSGDSWKDEVDWYSFWSSFLPMVIGVVLLLKGRAWAERIGIAHMRKEQCEPKDADNPMNSPENSKNQQDG
tara:strand:- start:77 stop:673 length:597 start_codon:yes stop_codon:yes gene_type:complete